MSVMTQIIVKARAPEYVWDTPKSSSIQLKGTYKNNGITIETMIPVNSIKVIINPRLIPEREYPTKTAMISISNQFTICSPCIIYVYYHC